MFPVNMSCISENTITTSRNAEKLKTAVQLNIFDDYKVLEI